jgi:hypothetical protein
MATVMLKQPLVVVGGLATLGIGAMAYTFFTRKTLKKKESDDTNEEQENNEFSYGELDDFDKPESNYLPHLKLMLGKETVEMLSMDKTWGELVDRVHNEFYIICSDYFTEFAMNVAGVVSFMVTLRKNKKMTFGTPRLFRQKLHPVIESIRKMRSVVESCAPSALVDFDELAAEIQRTHDDAANNIQLEATSGNI